MAQYEGPVVQSVLWGAWEKKKHTKDIHMKAVVSPTEGNDNCAVQSHFLQQLIGGGGDASFGNASE